MEATQPLGQTQIAEEEIQGLYGSITIPEATLQKIWLHKDFISTNLKTHSGQDLKVLSPGRWNRFEGPDFKEAELIIDGERVIGDVEIHFHPNDWLAHGHNLDVNFSNVVLHVTLFDPVADAPPAHTAHGYCPPTLAFLPYLRQSMEEYAIEEALLTFEARDNTELLQAFIEKPEEEVLILLKDKAMVRWRQKRAFARYRLNQGSWDEVCHQMVLEGLGYRRNRAGMSDIAHRYSLERMLEKVPGVDELYGTQEWKLAKLRPANHPRKRLEQYTGLVARGGNWTRRWLAQAEGLPYRKSDLGTSAYRKLLGMGPLSTNIKEEVFMGGVSGSRFHTLMIDGLLPLASAYLGRDFFNIWHHWYSGDMPSAVLQLLKASKLLEGGPPSPRLRRDVIINCNGLNQAILHLLVESSLIQTN